MYLLKTLLSKKYVITYKPKPVNDKFKNVKKVLTGLILDQKIVLILNRGIYQKIKIFKSATKITGTIFKLKIETSYQIEL